ncbi:hypothetical protein BT69DRAFT_1301198 [Atractiella rhizophila]|nr:hypothetical protein BT69DRAFT_1301198 [Atractiella rhizophila]
MGERETQSGERAPVRREHKWAAGDTIWRRGADLQAIGLGQIRAAYDKYGLIYQPLATQQRSISLDSFSFSLDRLKVYGMWWNNVKGERKSLRLERSERSILHPLSEFASMIPQTGSSTSTLGLGMSPREGRRVFIVNSVLTYDFDLIGSCHGLNIITGESANEWTNSLSLRENLSGHRQRTDNHRFS